MNLLVAVSQTNVAIVVNKVNVEQARYDLISANKLLLYLNNTTVVIKSNNTKTIGDHVPCSLLKYFED